MKLGLLPILMVIVTVIYILFLKYMKRKQDSEFKKINKDFEERDKLLPKNKKGENK